MAEGPGAVVSRKTAPHRAAVIAQPITVRSRDLVSRKARPVRCPVKGGQPLQSREC
jgi:hypothetical protein